MSTNPRRLGKYELRDSLGHGGMGEVWKAFDPQLRRYVAIKLLRADLQADPTFVARFTREAQVIASLQHPNIVQIYDFNVSQPPESERDTPYMVMRYVEGETLASLIRRTSRMADFLSPAKMVQLFTPISLAMDYAHQKGMIHRDIKPSNILLDRRNTSHQPLGEPILSDFGIVKLLGVTGTLSGGWMGTPHYTAPEQVMGAAGNERSDIYSLGVILYEVCTGVLPFQGGTPTEIMMQHVNTSPPAPMLINPAIPPTLTGVILRALAKDPAARFPSASAMVVALAEAFNMPIPKALNVVSSSTEVMYSPTHLSPLSPRLPPGGTGLPASLPVAPPPKSLPSPPMPLPQAAEAANSGQDIPRGIPSNMPNVPALPVSSAQLSAVVPSPQSASKIVPGPVTPWPAAQPPPPVARKRRRWLFVGLIVALILVLAGSGAGAFYLGRQSLGGQSFFGQFIRQPIVGHAFFISSGQIGETSNQGIMDELQIELSGVSAPAPGNSYYGWLQPDNNQTTTIAPILLGQLPVTNGTISFHYPGDAQHTNLLATMSRFLITEASTTTRPHIPSPDFSTWRYGAQLLPSFSPPKPGTLPPPNVAALTHLRGLLATEPELEAKGLPGGLDTWLFRNAEKVLEWSVSARDEWQNQGFPLLHRHIIRMLDYLDGLSFVEQDAPGQPVLVTMVNGQIGLLDVDPLKVDHGLLYKTDVDLNALIQSSFLMPDQRTFAIKIDAAVRNVERWLSNVRKDAQQLEPLSAAQLAQPTTHDLLDAMSNEALSAFAGRIDPTSGNVQDGVIQIHYDIQRLATFNIHPDSNNCFSYFCRKS